MGKESKERQAGAGMGSPGLSATQALVLLLQHPEGVDFFFKVAEWAEAAERALAIICRIQTAERERGNKSNRASFQREVPS